MNKKAKAILSTIALYVGIVLTFLIADKFDYKGGANDMNNTLMVFAGAVILVIVFFIRSIYKAIMVDKFYWAVACLHLVCMGFLAFNYMT